MISVHAGHAPAFGLGCGAVGLLNESLENRKVLREVCSRLNAYGIDYEDVTVTESKRAAEVLTILNQRMNSKVRDFNLSIHLNSAASASANGTECVVYSTDSKAYNLGKAISSSIAHELGLRDRGVKVNPTLSVLRNTKAATVIIECCFVTSSYDKERWSADKCAKAIVRAVASYMDIELDAPPSVPESPSEDVKEENALYRVQVGAFSKKENAEKLCRDLISKGYSAYIKKEDK